jgi:hypothetical protein
MGVPLLELRVSSENVLAPRHAVQMAKPLSETLPQRGHEWGRNCRSMKFAECPDFDLLSKR